MKPLIIPFFIPHFGCPHQCAFCNQSIITKKNSQKVDEASVHGSISEYLPYKGNRKKVELAFFGGNFLGLPQKEIIRLLGIGQRYVQEGIIEGTRFSTRPDTINKEILDMIHPFAISTIELGVQSMNPDVLMESKRGHTPEDSIRAIELLKKEECKLGVQVMAGLPGDNESSLIESTRKLALFEPDFARIYPLMVLKGSQVEKWYQQGAYVPLTLDESIILVKKMYNIFENAGVDVIRMGLQASDFMEDESKVIAGPWHPAFGHLVFSSMMYDQACKKIDQHMELVKSGSVILKVHPRSESRLRGNKNENIRKLQKQYPEMDVSIVLDDSILVDQVLTQA